MTSRRLFVRYKFQGVELRTENAAKSYKQANKWIVDFIAHLSPEDVVLDYGCGKFRYTIRLSRRARTVWAVDSTHQIDREQQIVNGRTTLREYAKKYLKNVSVCPISSKDWKRRKFDFVLCTNVLSVIPLRVQRVKVLRALATVIKPQGQILVSTQFRNTYFKQWASNPNATWVRDGWLVKGARGASFYSIIPPRQLGQLCRSAGLTLNRLGSHGETAFALARAR